MKFKKETFGSSKEILLNDDYAAIKVVVDDSGVEIDSDGKKIIKAGTPYPKDDATAQGILLYDTDVTYGKRPTALLVRGMVDVKKITLPTEAARKAMPQIKFSGKEYPTA
ncbi:MAG: hypothetical protein ACLRVU_01235 [Beduini sp.]|uniref:hypothetical protein n=1 Tax=Beduini sp. TaxID=1922300 RepID=UPI00399FAB5A